MPGVISEAGRADSLAVWIMQPGDGVQSATGTTISPWINLQSRAGRDCSAADWFITTTRCINRQSLLAVFYGLRFFYVCSSASVCLSRRQSMGCASAIQCLLCGILFAFLQLLFVFAILSVYCLLSVPASSSVFTRARVYRGEAVNNLYCGFTLSLYLYQLFLLEFFCRNLFQSEPNCLFRWLMFEFLYHLLILLVCLFLCLSICRNMFCQWCLALIQLALCLVD